MAVLFANNATTTLAGSINNVAVTCNVAPGTGTLFPNPTGGDYFIMTFTDSATGLVNEIVHVTARSGDTMTIVRAQEGTSAVAWNAGDLATAMITAGGLDEMVQDGELFIGGGGYFTDAGTANAITITLPGTVTSLSQIVGTPLRILLAATNTGATTISPVSFSAQPLVNPDGTALLGAQLVASGIATVVYDGTSFMLQSIAQAAPPGRHRQEIPGASGVFVVPNYVRFYTLTVTGAGGGAGGGDGTYAGSGGGAGGTAIMVMDANTHGRSITYSRGVGGAGGSPSSGGTNGTDSTASVTGVTLIGGGGTAGEHDSSPAGGDGGSASGTGAQLIKGGVGTDGSPSGVTYGGNGGASYWGGGGRASTASSPPIQDGAAPGSGGGGGYGGASVDGGAGANGIIIIEWGA